jgi:hypothetical protein
VVNLVASAASQSVSSEPPHVACDVGKGPEPDSAVWAAGFSVANGELAYECSRIPDEDVFGIAAAY